MCVWDMVHVVNENRIDDNIPTEIYIHRDSETRFRMKGEK